MGTMTTHTEETIQEYIEVARQFLEREAIRIQCPVTTPEYARQQFDHGVEIGTRAKTIYLSVTNVWSARFSDTESVQSYERIGYHSGTVELFAGFLASGCEIRRFQFGLGVDARLTERVIA
jgi:hypothetical protein